jgi:hypothetical protein
VEKCGKVWRQAQATAAQHTARRGVYARNGAGGAGEMRACSACAGDYEDPDRTAWSPDGAEDELRDDALRATTEEFPAEE